jgi:hypothetical protein
MNPSLLYHDHLTATLSGSNGLKTLPARSA